MLGACPNSFKKGSLLSNNDTMVDPLEVKKKSHKQRNLDNTMLMPRSEAAGKKKYQGNDETLLEPKIVEEDFEEEVINIKDEIEGTGIKSTKEKNDIDKEKIFREYFSNYDQVFLGQIELEKKEIVETEEKPAINKLDKFRDYFVNYDQFEKN
jgi:hypothetical protein